MTKIQIKEIKDNFVGQWLMKKTKLPFGRPARKVAFFLENFNLNNNRLYVSRTSGINYEIEKVLTDLEVVAKETAEKYQQIFDSCHELSSCVSNKRTHTREDGTPKRAFKPGKFAPALYSLKLKYPDYDCTAYICPECGKIHLGKQNMKVRITKLAPSYNPAVETASNYAEYKEKHISPPVDYWVEGDILSGFVEGDCLALARYIRNGVECPGFFTTSRIQKIHWDLGKFETYNSIYKFEFLPEPKGAAQDKDFVGGFLVKA